MKLLIASLLSLVVVAQAFDTPSHWSLRNAAGGSAQAPSNGEIAEMMNAMMDRIESLEVKDQQKDMLLSEQAEVIADLKTKLEKADTLHRYLVTSDADCLPKFLETERGPRCDFSAVMRFQDNVFFNDDVIFNSNVEFDNDAVCMPIFNATTKQCTIRNNYTYTADVQFQNKTYFNKDSYVKFQKDVFFEDDVKIQNSHKDIDFIVDDKVNVNFKPDHRIYFHQDTTFKDHVKMEKDLHVDGHTYLDGTDIDGDLDVNGHTYLDGTDVDGDLDVSGDGDFHGRVYANDGITAKDGIEVKTGKLDVKEGGAHIYGHVTMNDDALVKGNLEVLGAQIYSGNVVIDGKLTVNDGARINTIHTDPALYVDGKSMFRNNMDVTKKITAGALDLDGENGNYPVPLYVKGDGKFDGEVFASNFNYHAPTEAPAPLIDIDIEKVMVAISQRVLIVKNLFVGTEDPDNEVINLGRLRSQSVRVQSIDADNVSINGKAIDPDGGDTPEGLVGKLGQFGGIVSLNAVETKSLMVEGTAMVGQEEILTTADADAMASSAAAESAPAPTCDCSEDRISDIARDACSRDHILGRIYDTSPVFSSVSVITNRETDPWETTRLTPGGGGGGCECDLSEFVTESEVREMTGLQCNCPAAEESSTMTSGDVESIVSGMGFLTECSCDGGDAVSLTDVEELIADSCSCDTLSPSEIAEMGFVTSDEIDDMGFLTSCPCGDGE